MKKLLLSFLVLSSVLGFQSCSEDFEVAAPYKPVTVVYGMLNMKDTAHYVRIQKTFLDENKNAFDMAKVSDSNFYKEADIEVMIKELSGNAVVGQPIMLKRVEMTAEGYPKDPGTFFTSPNYAYKFKHPLNPAYTYRLVINNKATNTMDSADIKLVDSAKVRLSGNNNIKREIKFASSGTGQMFVLYMDQSIVGNAYFVEAAMRFKWVEKNLNTNEEKRDSADFLFATISGDQIKELKLQAENYKFYGFLNSAMGPASDGIVRYMDSCDILLYASGKEFADYLATQQIQSSGLTADQIKPVYTNIRGKDVFGLFTSRADNIIYDAYIGDVTMDSLMHSVSTAALNIRGRVTP